MQLKGFVNLNKPIGFTSSDAVVKARGILRRVSGEKQKVGHLGTLDPEATGVLPIAVGKATKLFDYSLEKLKTYEAVFTFGTETDTLDKAGKITKSGMYVPTANEIKSVLGSFLGNIAQIPPSYSAKSVDGKRAYDLARNGKDFELPPKEVEIFSLELLSNDNSLPNVLLSNALSSNNSSYNASLSNTSTMLLDDCSFKFKIVCGSGTYIRSLARDIAKKLDTCAYMSSLTRTKSGDFSLESSVTFEEFEKNPLENLLPLDFVFSRLTRFDLPINVADKVLNGIRLKLDGLPFENQFAVYHQGEPIALGTTINGELVLTLRF